ncbi:MAG: hypothetical protein AAGA11_10595 [Pseudomonadota bacterium]
MEDPANTATNTPSPNTEEQEKRPTRMVLCVHGIGNQAPGETIENVMSGALAEHDRHAGAPPLIANDASTFLFDEPFTAYEGLQQPKRITVPGIVDDAGELEEFDTVVHTHSDGKQPKREGTQAKFPVHIKTLRRQRETRVETVMAEVFWADLSKEPKGAFATIFDLIKVVMSVGYLALDNAANVGSVRAYRAVSVFLFLLIGGVVALNASLLFGALVLLSEGTFFSIDANNTRSAYWMEALIAVAAAITLLVGALTFALNRFAGSTHSWTPFVLASSATLATTFFLTVFWLSGSEKVLAATAFLTITFALFIGRTRWHLSLWRIFSCGAAVWGFLSLALIPFITDPERVPSKEQEIVLFSNLLTTTMQYIWASAVLVCLLVYAAWGLDRVAEDRSDDTDQTRIYAPICSALLMLWMLVASSIWLITGLLGKQHRTQPLASGHCSNATIPPLQDAHCHGSDGVFLDLFQSFIDASSYTMAVAVASLFALLVVGIYVFVQRRLNKAKLAYLGATSPSYARVLLNYLFQLVFALSTLGFLGVILFHGIADDPLAWLQDRLPEKAWKELKELSDQVPDLLSYVPIVLIGLGLIVYSLRDLVAGGLGAFRDVVVYANNDRLDPTQNNANFPLRERIEKRFEQVCEVLVDHIKPKEIVVIAHSQGTVVASRTIKRMLEDRRAYFGEAKITLVTMGSPVTHLYQQYFPRDFSVRPGEFPDITWYNIGRTDDFVGTHIECLDEINAGTPSADQTERRVPLHTSKYNLMVPAGGHPGYFTDPYVWQRMHDTVGFRLVDWA